MTFCFNYIAVTTQYMQLLPLPLYHCTVKGLFSHYFWQVQACCLKHLYILIIIILPAVRTIIMGRMRWVKVSWRPYLRGAIKCVRSCDRWRYLSMLLTAGRSNRTNQWLWFQQNIVSNVRNVDVVLENIHAWFL